MLQKILDYAQTQGSSDVHLVTHTVPMIRSIGELIRLELPSLDPDEMRTYIQTILSVEHYNQVLLGQDVDAAYSDLKGNRYRINIYRQQGQLAMAMRLLHNHIPTLEELGMPTILKDLALQPRGLVIVTGPTGSGKSTTLAAMIDLINTEKGYHILTLEDPIEYQHRSQKSLVNQREIHKDVSDFATALRSALREDPDVILVGEMRDYETISLALTAAETGHLVLSTLHTTGAANTIDRIIDAFPPHQQAQIRTQLSGVLKGVISQTLVPRLDQKSRVAVHEILLMTDAVGNLIRENKIVQIDSVIQTSSRLGMQYLDASLARLVSEHVISFEDAQEVARNPELLKRLLMMK